MCAWGGAQSGEAFLFPSPDFPRDPVALPSRPPPSFRFSVQVATEVSTALNIPRDAIRNVVVNGTVVTFEFVSTDELRCVCRFYAC